MGGSGPIPPLVMGRFGIRTFFGVKIKHPPAARPSGLEEGALASMFRDDFLTKDVVAAIGAGHGTVRALNRGVAATGFGARVDVLGSSMGYHGKAQCQEGKQFFHHCCSNWQAEALSSR